MSTSVNTNTAASGATNIPIATEIIASDAFQRIKLAVGAVGFDSGDVSAANPLPVVQTGTPALPTGASTESTLSTLNGKIPATVGGSQPTTLRNAAGTAIGSQASGTTVEGLLIAAGSTEFYFSTVNSSTAQLAAAATFTGTIESIVNAQAWSILVVTDQNGTLTVREYVDAGGTRVSSVRTFSVVAGSPFSRCFTANGNYFNATFQNNGGSTTTTLNINVAYGTLPAVTSLGNGPVALNEINGSTFSLGQTTMAASLPVAIASNQAVFPVNLQAAGTAISVNQGAADAGTLRVAVNNEQVQDLFITGQGAQSASGNNVFLATAGTGSTDTVAASGLVSYRSFYTQIIGSAGIASGQILFEGSNDNTTFNPLTVYDDAVVTGTPINAALSIAASTSRFFSGKTTYKFIRCRISTVFSGGTIQAITRFSITDYVPRVQTVGNPTAANLLANVTTCSTVTTLANGQTAHSAASTGSPVRVGGRVVTALDTSLATGDASDLLVTTGQQLVTKDFATSENDWQFACAAGGIVNTTTGVTVKAAGAASIRNFMTSISLSADALGAATEVIVYDGTTATVLWRTKLQAAGLASQTFVFPTPLRGTAATLMGVATVTATVTGGVIFSCSGYQSF
jgi:hypothetical protein